MNRLLIKKLLSSLIFWQGLLIFFFFGWWGLHRMDLLVDENTHYLQILRFFHQQYELRDGLTMIPGYHLFMAFWGRVFFQESVIFMRSVTTITSLATVGLFYLCAKEIKSDCARLKTWQLATIPFLFPFCFLLYTDIFSLFLVLIMVYFSLRKHYPIAGFFGILSVLVRQNNIIWFGVPLWFIIKDIYNKKSTGKKIKLASWSLWIYLLGVFGFLFFVWKNGSVALGDQRMHPDFGLFTGNLFLGLFLLPYLFFPVFVGQFASILKKSIIQKWPFFVMIGILILYWFTFDPNHPFNTHPYFLRNRLLIFASHDTTEKLLFALPILLSSLFLLQMRFSRLKDYVLLGLSLLYLMPSWLIEERYLFIPLTLLVLFRKPTSRWSEWIMVGWNLIWAIVILFIIKSENYFL